MWVILVGSTLEWLGYMFRYALSLSIPLGDARKVSADSVI